MKPLVYVSGPITGNPFGCVRESIPAFKWLLDHGCLGFMPQWTVIAEMIDPLPYETYLAYDFGVIDHCQAVVRLPGVSPGADRECEYAATVGVPVFDWNAAGRAGLLAMAEGVPVAGLADFGRPT